MARPCFLVIDREYAGSISTRKLVIETAKFNVITAYTGKEALETLEKFPAVDGAVLDAGLADISTQELVTRLKERRKHLPVIVVSSPGCPQCDNADHQLDTFDPTRLIALLRAICPAEATVVDQNEKRLEQEKLDSSA